ncbi:hypothetical protein N431DRAFT_321692, partial [Stipitochalara longipes BDJ]
EIVTIYVGPEKKPFIIHKEVACLHSPVFKTAFESTFVEGQTQSYVLEDTEPEIFQLLVQWLYSKTFQFSLSDADIVSLSASTRHWASTSDEKIMAAKAIAGYLQIPRLQNLVIDRLEDLRVHCNLIAFGTLNYLYETFPPEALIRKLVFEHCALFLSSKVYQTAPDFFPKQMLVDQIVTEKQSKEQPLQLDPFTNREEFKRRFHVPEG